MRCPLGSPCFYLQHDTCSIFLEIGGRVLDDFEDDREQRFQQELDDALAEAEARAEHEKQRALMRLRKQMEEAQATALQAQKEYFEKVAKRVAEQRDR